MVEIWFGILCFMLTTFVILDGWDIGVGAVHLIVAKTDSQRRDVVAAVGPLWSWHEVWLVAAGGTFVLAFPRILATAFAGYYLALWLVLWCFILRGISIEVAGHIDDPLWQKSWDFVFSVSNILLAIIFGAALGNVIRGVPLGPDGKFSLALFTDFGVRGDVGILDWYTLTTAIFSLVLLSAHGTTYLTLKTAGPVHDRSHRLAGLLWISTAVLFPFVTAATWYVRPDAFVAMAHRPVGLVLVAVAIGAAGAVVVGRRSGNELLAFGGSCGLIAGLLGAMAVAVFPVMLYSTLGVEHSLTAFNGSSSTFSLTFALFWWPLALGLSCTYFVFVLKHYIGRVSSSADD